MLRNTKSNSRSSLRGRCSQRDSRSNMVTHRVKMESTRFHSQDWELKESSQAVKSIFKLTRHSIELHKQRSVRAGRGTSSREMRDRSLMRTLGLRDRMHMQGLVRMELVYQGLLRNIRGLYSRVNGLLDRSQVRGSLIMARSRLASTVLRQIICRHRQRGKGIAVAIGAASEIWGQSS